MPSELITVTLYRDPARDWGFELTGGKDVDEPLSISNIRSRSIADIVGLKLDDVLVRIDGNETAEKSYHETIAYLDERTDVELTIERSCARKISYEKAATKFSIFIGASGDTEVVQGSNAFYSNRLEMERTTTADIRLKSPSAEEQEEETHQVEQAEEVQQSQDIQVQGEEVQHSQQTRIQKVEEKEEQRRPAEKVTVEQVQSERETHVEEIQQEPLQKMAESKEASIEQNPNMRQFKFQDESGKVVKVFREKADSKRDWNCPWVRGDGKGLKRLLRPSFTSDPVVAPVHTSLAHFYSEPHSILEPPMSDEEVREMQQKFFEEQRRLVELENEKRRREIEEMERKKQEEEQRRRNEILEAQRKEQERLKQLQMEKEDEERRQRQSEMEEQQQQEDDEKRQNKHVRFQEEQHHGGDSEVAQQPENSTSPLEAIFADGDEETKRIASEILREEIESGEGDAEILNTLAKAIQAGMDQYRSNDGYEPSADELIEVLKSLENLAASNPALYRAIVDQIKSHQDPQESEVVHQDNNNEENCQRMSQEYEEADCRMEDDSTNDDRKVRENGTTEEAEVEEQRRPKPDFSKELKEIEESEIPPVEPFPEVLQPQQQRQPQQQQRRQPEQPQEQQAAASSPTPMNGNSSEVDHISPPQGQQQQPQQGFYPKPMQDYDYPWAGSLKPVSKELFSARHKRAGSNDPGDCPWAGSLRHVGDNNKRRSAVRKSVNLDLDDDGGRPPWMGSLRHVHGPNQTKKSFKTRVSWQKRYPEEDAPNPFQKKPPMTNGADPEIDEKINRVKTELKEKKAAISGPLLKVLMPKLLKEHQSKYQPLEEGESMRIMEEILTMKMGLDKVGAEDSEEANRMIQAIEQGEIDKSVYSQMADDLEKAVRLEAAPATPPPSPVIAEAAAKKMVVQMQEEDEEVEL